MKTLRSEMLIFLRWAITLIRFERELYRNPGAIESSVVGIRRAVSEGHAPENRDRADWASKIHLASSPVYYQNYVLGELMASQLLRYIHRDVAQTDGYVGHGTSARISWKKSSNRAHVRLELDAEEATGQELSADHFIAQFV
jgi:peptidyl-dipeptidase A